MPHHMLHHEDERVAEFRVNGTAAIVVKHVPGKPAELRHMSVREARQEWKAAEAEGFKVGPLASDLVNATDALLAFHSDMSRGSRDIVDRSPVCRCSVDPHCQEPKLTPTEMGEVLQEAGFKKQSPRDPQDVWERVKRPGRKIVVWTGAREGEFVLGDPRIQDQVLVTAMTQKRKGELYQREAGVGIPFGSLTKEGLLEAMREEWKKA